MQTVTYIGTPPNQDVYLDLVCGSAEEALALLEAAPWAARVRGTPAKVRAVGTPHSVDTQPYAKKGLRVTISAGE